MAENTFLRPTIGEPDTVAEFSELAIPTELFPTRGGLGPRFEACLFVAHEIVRPLSWLGLLDDGNLKQKPHVRLEERLIRKTALFDRFVRLIITTADGGQRVH
ncbi:hypothetical protein [Pararhizobium sp. PWRC1-1]|uniref:hypothetical protein n=1 Tax=Pararhizobium sp. PWRC1-1 TaxID=2804566 RepID=UPI003CEFA7FA